MASANSFFSQLFVFVGRLRYLLSPPALSDQDLCEWQCDSVGNLKVVVLGGSFAGSGPTSEATSTAFEKSHVVKSTAGALYELTGTNKSGSAVYVMLFDSATVPSNGVAKKYQLHVPAGAPFTWAPSKALQFTTGIVWVVSSTADTLTISATNDVDATAFYA